MHVRAQNYIKVLTPLETPNALRTLFKGRFDVHVHRGVDDLQSVDGMDKSGLGIFFRITHISTKSAISTVTYGANRIILFEFFLGLRVR